MVKQFDSLITHLQVVATIRETGDETYLLVVDSASDSYFQGNKIPITKDLIENGKLKHESNSVC